MKGNFEKEKIFIAIGLILALIGIVFNEWVLASLFSPDGTIKLSFRLIIWFFDIMIIILGVVIIYYRRSLSNIDYKTYLLSFISVVIAFVLLEIGSYLTMRYLIRYHDYSHNKSERSLRIFNKESDILTFGIKRNFEQVFSKKEFRTTVKTNNVGLRENRDFNGESIDIAFVGDSFTFGYGVSNGERYSDLLQSYFPQKNILSLSYLNGWTIPHYYLFLKNNPQYIPNTLIMGLYYKNDLSTDIEETNFVYDKDGNLVSAKSSRKEVTEDGMLVSKGAGLGISKTYDYLESFYTGKLILIALGRITGTYQKTDKISQLNAFHKGELNEINLIGLNYIQKTKKFLDKYNTRLIVFIIPESFAVSEYPERCPYVDNLCIELRQGKYIQKSITKWLSEHNIEFIEPSSEFIEYEEKGIRLYHTWDGHWNKNGHKIASKLIYHYLTTHNL